MAEKYVTRQEFRDHKRDKKMKHHFRMKKTLAENAQISMMNYALIDELTEQIKALEKRVKILEGGGNGDYPPEVNDLATLKQFVLAELGQDAYKPYEEKKIPAAIIRDALAARYRHIARLNDDPIGNGYTAPEHKHRDAFWHYGQDTIIDFVKGSSDPGAIFDSLQWARETETPW